MLYYCIYKGCFGCSSGFFLGKIRFYTFYRSANLLDSNCELLFYYQAILPHGPYKNVNKGHF